jgi:hypothetical protein
MKKFTLMMAACLVAAVPLLAGGCAPEPEPNEYTIADFFPFSENMVMVYEGQGMEYAAYTTYVDYITDNRIQIRTNNGGTEIVSVLENSNGELRVITEQPETYYRLDLTGIENAEGDIVLKEPLETGTSWALNGGGTREITGMDISVETPSGIYDAMEVTTTVEGKTVIDYYAQDIGLVKTVFGVDGDEVTSALKEMIDDGTWDTTLTVYGFEVTDTDVLSVKSDVALSMRTNENIADALIGEFRDKGLASEGTGLNSLAFDETGQILIADFSKEFVTEMNAGTAKEMGVLSGVVNTLGTYFQTEKVRITLDGDVYSSGHIELNENEYFVPKYGDKAEVDIQD